MTNVLVVDDERGPREALRMILKDEFSVVMADSGESAAEMVERVRPAAILLDIRLGRVDGIEALRMIRSVDSTAQVAMITAYASLETARLAMRLGAVDYLTKPFDCNNVRQVVRNLVTRHDALHQDTLRLRTLEKSNVALTEAVAEYQEQMRTNYAGTVVALISAIDAKDTYTRNHSVRVSMVAEALAYEMGLSSDEADVIRTAGLVHDIGKIGVPEHVLRKSGRLTTEEWEMMKRHPLIGAEIIASVPSLQPMEAGVLQHHERPDGKGYPMGLPGDAIASSAAILSVADAMDAMSHDRSYRSALAPDRIVDELLMGSGSQWATEVVDAALRARVPYRSDEFQAAPGQFPFEK